MIISEVSPDGIGAELGLCEGDELCQFNDAEAGDLLDYIYYDSREQFLMTVRRGEELFEFEIEKDEEESLGLGFADNGLKARSCRNRCVFCFVDQLPKGLRKSLYVKDDDYRHSLIYGNYVTLTNLSGKDVSRILEYGLSPLYVSVHTTDGELRKRMLSNPNAGKILDQLKLFAAHGIFMHTQIVMCPGFNDGAELLRTLGDLSELSPAVRSVAVVPLGMTKFRDKLAELSPVTPKIAEDTLGLVGSFREKLKREDNLLEVWCSDEFYIRAGKEIPKAEFYADFAQLEDGVGILSKFESDLLTELSESEGKKYLPADVVSGVSAYGFMKGIADKLNGKFGDFVHLHLVENEFFGKSITVSGLLVGADLFRQLKGKLKTNRLILPRVMLRDRTTVFLDDTTVEELAEKLGVEIVISEPGGFLRAFEGGAPVIRSK